MEIAVKDVVEVAELHKKRIELELKKSYLELNKNDEDSLKEISQNLENVEKSLKELLSKTEKAGIRFNLIGQEKISDINSKLSTFSPSDQVNALLKKEGEVYELLKERGEVLKRNIENRENLAKLLILVSKITDPDMRYRMIETVKAGSIREAVTVDGCSESQARKMVRVLNRLGISASVSEDGKTITGSPSKLREIPFVISNKKVWVAAEAADRLSENLSKLEKLSPQLQWKNAQRQIKDFSDDEENEFKDLQRKYLDLLKEQDEILKDFHEESSLAVKVS